MPPPNIHATGLVIGDRGVLITGASGAGKTTLALALIDCFQGRGLYARLVGDDQLFVSARGGRPLMRAPPAISGLAEVHGIGPRPLSIEPAAVVDLVVRLVPAEATERLQEEATQAIAGCPVPRIDSCERNVAAALPLVAARLGLPPFSPA